MKKILFFVVIISSISLAQNYGNRFVIAPGYYANVDYTIDRLAQQLYFSFYLKVDLKTGVVDTTELMDPTFANQRHLMLNRDTLYDLNKGTYFAPVPQGTITNSSYWHFYSYSPPFSPNDSNLMFSIYSGSDQYENFIFSLKDSSFAPIDTNVLSSVYYYGNQPQWSSDTSFVYPVSDSALAEYFIRSRRIDTLVSLHNHSTIWSFAYNTKENILSYGASILVEPNFSERVYFHYKDSTTDYLAFSQERDDSLFFNGILSYLCWSPNNDKLGFLSFDGNNRACRVYLYSLNSNRSYDLTSWKDYGNWYSLQWANEDTVVYFNATDGQLYGINISNVDEIREDKNNNLPSDFCLSSYPNPFNPSTTFEITLPWGKNAVLSIYNIKGQLIKEYHIRNVGTTKYRIIWNAVNNQGERIASGVYIAALNSENSKNKIIKTSKIIYLK